MLIGEFHENVLVGKPTIVIDKYGRRKKSREKSIDLLCKTLDATQVLEVKADLNPT